MGDGHAQGNRSTERCVMSNEITLAVDSRLDSLLNSLKVRLNKSRAEVFSTAIALLKVAVDAQEEGLKLAVVDCDDQVKKEIVLT